MSTGLFSDEEDGYNLEEQELEETKYVLKGSAPSTDSSMEPTDDSLEGLEDVAPEGDIEGLADVEPTDDKPFDDEPFDAGVEADEDTDPEKFIQQLSGKLGQSLRQYSEDEGQPDFDLEKFAVNSVLSATHTGEMDKEDQRDIINKVKGSGNEDPEDMEAEPEMDAEPEVDGEESLDFGEEPVEEIVEELPLSTDENGVPFDGGLGGCDKANPITYDAVDKLKDIVDLEEVDSKFGNDERFGKDERFGNDKRWGLQESKKSSNFVDKEKLIKTLRLMENSEPIVEPQPITKPNVAPTKPTRETDRPFLPKRKDKVQPKPKAKGDINEMGQTNTVSFDGKEVEISSLTIDDVKYNDYPDFTDAYFNGGEYSDGIEMTDEELIKFQDENLDLLNSLIFDRFL